MKSKTKINFVVTLKDGNKIEVTYQPDFLNHLEFRGNISETGYWSAFPFPVNSHPSLDEIKKRSTELAQVKYDVYPGKYGSPQTLF